MADKPPDPQNALTVVPVASIMILRELLVEIKLSKGQLNFDSLVDRILANSDSAIGKGHPLSAQLVKLLIDEVRSIDA
ncbi:hypothetical protein [Variovorax sp. N23]|uniref:hypothetical protein n=1 Tax=Variovorax sp. N23 TaxID=2980555 RepID=UPI0021C84337|nr:hypothetical protein [Variovorax sp. N23]MCU4121599.1 hypothetical protein [Variovorax sp. N23]